MDVANEIGNGIQTQYYYVLIVQFPERRHILGVKTVKKRQLSDDSLKQNICIVGATGLNCVFNLMRQRCAQNWEKRITGTIIC